eukprot:gene30849-35889_t
MTVAASAQGLQEAASSSSRKILMEVLEACGKIGRWTIDLCSFSINMGCMVAYLNMMADVLSSVAGTIIPPGAEPSRNAYVVGVTVFGAFPMAMFVRDHALMTNFSKVSVLFMSIFCGIIVIFAISPEESITAPVSSTAEGDLVWIHGPVHVSEVDLMYLSSMDLQSNYLNVFICKACVDAIDMTKTALRALFRPQWLEYWNATKLALLDLSSNCLFGSIPDVVVEGLAGAIVTVAGNLLSCCGFQFNGSCNVQSYQVYDFNNYPLLPSGLFFSDHVYRPYENSAAVGPQTLSIEAPNSGLLM